VQFDIKTPNYESRQEVDYNYNHIQLCYHGNDIHGFVDAQVSIVTVNNPCDITDRTNQETGHNNDLRVTGMSQA